MLAEAYLRTNMLTEAAEIINNTNNPRKIRGGLADIATSKDEILEAIFYERDIELFLNGYLIHFCDMRRRDMLQHGTQLHFPIPANELIRLNMNVYTFGGIENADGINTSNGGDWIKPYYHFTVD
jgi:starch-binding outer membrane protein, SusD/RagB family